jgi:CBS domain-containing protein
MAAHRIGALAVTSADTKKVIGIVSERDYLSKVALLGRSSKTTLVAEIATMGANLVTVTDDEPVDDCMKKLLARDCRHLLVKDSKGDITGLFSIKDLCKCVVAKHTEVVERLVNFNTGKGAFFGSE